MKISIPQQLAIRPRVDDLAKHPRQEHAIGHGHDTVLHREEQDAEAYHFLDDFQLQKDVAASQRVDSIEVRCMDGPEHVVDAEDAQERHARQPLLRQHERHDVCRRKRQDHHHRRHDEDTRLDSPPRHITHPLTMILLTRHCWEQDAIDRSIDVGDNKIRELLSLIEEG